MMVPRSFSLGREGEEQWDRLRAAHAVSQRRGRVMLVASDSRDVRDEIRRRLGSLTPRLEIVEPSGEVVTAVHELGRDGAEDAVPVAWIEAPVGVPAPEQDERWAEALAMLNRARDALQTQGPCHVVLAGPRGLNEVVRKQAPDLSSFMNTVVLLGETLESLMTEPVVLTWMHLSDLHVGGEDWQRDDVLDALVRDLPGLLEQKELQPDLLLVTGDVAYSGQREEYDGASAALGRIVEILGLDRHERVFMVPGNHDVDRKAIGPTARRDHASLIRLRDADELRDTVSTLFDEPVGFKLYGDRLTQWCAFTSRFLGRARSVAPERPWRSDVVVVHGVRVGVLSLCTAWMSGKDHENGELMLGERQLVQLVREVRDDGAQLVVALMHHPLDWLHPQERSAIRGRLEREVDLVLHGHEHEAHSAVRLASGSTHAMLGAGAAYARLGKDHYHGFSVGRFDSATGTLDVHHFTWSTRASRWIVDTGAPGADDQGCVRQSFAPTRLGSTSPAEAVDAQEVLASRLRHATAHVYAGFDLASLGIGGPRRTITLDQVFVPLDLQSWDRMGGVDFGDGPPDDDDDIMDGRGLKDLGWLEMMLDDGERFVVLGDPGSGKSTLCKHLAVSYAKREDGWVPLLLTVRDWIAEGAREGLLDMGAREATQRLSVRTSAEALEALCERGKVLLIVDGIDEAADVTTRRSLRDRVHGFAATHPRVPMLVTSRHAGYREIPLDEHVFEQLDVAPFDDDALELFVQRWYEVFEPHDPAKRLRKRTNLLQALEREPRARALTRTPLLAALVAGVHSSYGQLPGSRARLYEKVVEQLLDVRPRERGQGFDELPWTEQLPMLEKLALRLQERRETHGDQPGAQILLKAEQLEEVLIALLREWRPELRLHKAGNLARRWSRWLVTVSGLLQEQQPGMVGFVHLSLMEYLAGQALLNQSQEVGYDAIVALVVERYARPIWREVLLLMLGSQGNDPALGDRIVDTLTGSSSNKELGADEWGTATFLLATLREEIDMSPSRRDLVLDLVCNRTYDIPNHRAWQHVSSVLGDIVRFGRKHGPSTEQWAYKKLTDGSANELIETLALIFDSDDWMSNERLEAALRARDDIDRVTPALLNFAPSHRFAVIGRKLASPIAHLRWASTTSLKFVVWRSLSALDATYAEAWVPSMLERTAWVGSMIPEKAEVHRERWSHRLPLTVSWATEGVSPISVTLAPSFYAANFERSATEAKTYPWSFAHAAVCRFLFDFASRFSSDPPAHTDYRSYLALSVDFPEVVFTSGVVLISEDGYTHRDPSAFAHHFTSIFREHIAHRYFQHLDLKGAVGFVRRFERELADSISVQSNDEVGVPMPTLWSYLDSATTEEELYSAAATLLLTLIAEVHAGLQTTTIDNTPQPFPLLPQLRLENRWLNLFFTPLVEYTTRSRPLPEHPDLHALLLTFGLAQYQTTWQWPDCPHWRSWFSAPPPDHWLPAHIWHLVRSIQDPADPTHRQHAESCLDRTDWPELAQALRAYTFVPTPPEIHTLFDRDSGTGP